MEVLQVSNFATHIKQVVARPADVLVVGEHSMDKASAESMVAQLKKTYNISSIFSGVDPELKHLTGGVGGLARSPHRIFPVNANTQTFRALEGSGRLQMFCLDVGASSPILCFVVYGWTGGRTDPTAASRTNGLVAAIGEEANSHPEFSCCFCGDLNADPDHLPALKLILEEQAWVDCGANASIWGHKDSQITCTSYNATTSTRNDFFFCQSCMLPYIHDFEVVADPEFSVHSVLRITWRHPRHLSDQTINLQPPSMINDGSW